MAYQYPLNGGRINASIGGNSTSAGAGYQLISTGTLNIAGGNNITLSQNGQSITISGANAPSGSINFSASNTSANLASLTFSNSNGVSFGLTNGTLTASHNGITSQSAQTIGGYATGNTTGQSSSSTFDARSMSMSGVGGVSLGYSGSMLQVSGPAVSSLSQTGIVSISRNGSTISIGAPAVSMGMSNIGNTSGTSGTVSNQLIFAGGNNVTLSQSTGAGGNTITISAFNPTANLYVSSNSTQLSSTAGVDLRSITFQGAGNVSVGVSQGKVLVSGGAGGGGVALYDGANSITSGTARISAGGALTASVNGQTLSINAPAQSNLSATGAVSISTNGATISIGAPVQTNQTLGISATSNTFSSSNGTVDARSLYLRGVGAASVGISNGSILISAPNAGAGNVTFSAGTTSAGLASLVFSNSNGVSFGLNGSTLTASAAGGGGGIALANSQTTYTSGTANMVVAGGAMTIASTTGQSFNFSVPATSSISATGAFSISTNGSTVSMGVPAFSAGASTGGNTAGNTMTVSNQLILAGGNNITLSQTTGAGGATLSIIGGAGGGGGIAFSNSQTSYSSGTVQLLEAANAAITIASTTGSKFNVSVPALSSLTAAGAISLSSNGSTITVSAPQNGTISNWEPMPFNMASTGSTALGSGGASQMFYKLQPQAYVSASQFLQMVSASLSTSSNSSYAGTITIGAGIYTATGSTLSLITASSGSASYTWSNTSNNLSASLSGLRALTLPMNVNMSPGDYWLGMWSRTSSTRANWATFGNIVATGGGAVSFGGLLMAAANATQGVQGGVGYYNATTSGLMASAAMSSITQSNVVSNQMQYVAFKNQTW